MDLVMTNKNRMVSVLLPLVVAIVIGGCDFDPSAITAKQKELDSRLTKLENAPPAPVIPPTPPIPTVLWVQNPGAYPRASSYFNSKYECAETAAQWGFPDDKKAKQIGTDPWITTSSKKDQYGQQAILTVSCLPQGVTPYAAK
jgi:hypothetical protein